jgi:DNA-binding CsgD family transcriptional regulator
MVCPTDASRGGAAGPLPGADGGPAWFIPTPRTTGDDRPGRAPAHLPAGRSAVPLTARDRELLRHLGEGRSTSQIAAAMSVSTNTARTRIRRVSAKLAVTGRHELVGAAQVRGLV